MTTIYFIRHGEYENPFNLLPLRMKGFPLSQLGKDKIKGVGNFLKDKNISVIYSSPILRTRQSAQILSNMLGIQIYFSKSLIEVNSPGLQGKDKFMIKDTFKLPLHIQAHGETIEHIYLRMNRIVSKILREHSHNSVAVVSHGDPLMIYTLKISGKTIDGNHAITDYDTYIPKSGMTKIDYVKGQFHDISKINY